MVVADRALRSRRGSPRAAPRRCRGIGREAASLCGRDDLHEHAVRQARALRWRCAAALMLCWARTSSMPGFLGRARATCLARSRQAIQPAKMPKKTPQKNSAQSGMSMAAKGCIAREGIEGDRNPLPVGNGKADDDNCDGQADGPAKNTLRAVIPSCRSAGLAQFLAGLEEGHALGRHLNGPAGARIAARCGHCGT